MGIILRATPLVIKAATNEALWDETMFHFVGRAPTLGDAYEELAPREYDRWEDDAQHLDAIMAKEACERNRYGDAII